jgi:aryl-alcohol dehydrogenase-like predicted oxidoreductase
LRRLGTDYIDVLVAHRDNLEYRVDEMLEQFMRLKAIGMIREFGVSNWTLPRLAEATEAVELDQRFEVSLVSNQFSLSRPVRPPYAESVVANSVEWKAWLTRRHFPLLAWSSLGRGFFAESQSPDIHGIWHTADNFKRQSRVKEVANDRGVSPVAIALAWVLAHDFPAIAAIGPASSSELYDCLVGLDITLDGPTCHWLDGL